MPDTRRRAAEAATDQAVTSGRRRRRPRQSSPDLAAVSVPTWLLHERISDAAVRLYCLMLERPVDVTSWPPEKLHSALNELLELGAAERSRDGQLTVRRHRPRPALVVVDPAPARPRTVGAAS